MFYAMSADNRLCIMPWGGLQWFVWNGSGSEEYYEPPYHAIPFMSRKEAEAWLDAEEKRIEYLEYGVGEICREEQEAGLVGIIADCQRRLHNLRTKGHQYPNWTKQ